MGSLVNLLNHDVQNVPHGREDLLLTISIVRGSVNRAPLPCRVLDGLLIPIGVWIHGQGCHRVLLILSAILEPKNKLLIILRVALEAQNFNISSSSA